MKVEVMCSLVHGTWSRKVLGRNLDCWLPWDKAEKVEMQGAANWGRVSSGDDGNVLECMELMLVKCPCIAHC